ncbi:hypothetical protein MMC07_002301 [Pseudocyphellaria aurata]|nr:hypothetical protein [Pseudocyphellaria aurata]
MALPATPTDPYATVDAIKDFLPSLHKFPGSPHVISAPISFLDKYQKTSWIKAFTKPDKDKDGNDGDERMDFTKCFTYSDSFGEKSKDNSTNRIGLLNRPLKNWVGKTHAETDWTHAAWDSIAFAWINTPNTQWGKDLIVYDVENVKPNQVSKWKDYLHAHYKRGDEFRDEDKCLEYSLDWLRQVTILGDKALTDTDWKSLGWLPVYFFLLTKINSSAPSRRLRAAAMAMSGRKKPQQIKKPKRTKKSSEPCANAPKTSTKNYYCCYSTAPENLTRARDARHELRENLQGGGEKPRIQLRVLRTGLVHTGSFFFCSACPYFTYLLYAVLRGHVSADTPASQRKRAPTGVTPAGDERSPRKRGSAEVPGVGSPPRKKARPVTKASRRADPSPTYSETAHSSALRRVRQRDAAEEAVRVLLKENQKSMSNTNKAITAIAAAVRRRSPPTRYPMPVMAPLLCVRCAKAGFDEPCIRANPYVKCDYCRRNNNACLEMPAEFWPTARRLERLFHDARHNRTDRRICRAAREAAEDFTFEIEGVRRREARRLHGKSDAEKAAVQIVEGLKPYLRTTAQYQAFQAGDDMQMADPAYGIGSLRQRRHRPADFDEEEGTPTTPPESGTRPGPVGVPKRSRTRPTLGWPMPSLLLGGLRLPLPSGGGGVGAPARGAMFRYVRPRCRGGPTAVPHGGTRPADFFRAVDALRWVRSGFVLFFLLP